MLSFAWDTIFILMILYFLVSIVEACARVEYDKSFNDLKKSKK